MHPRESSRFEISHVPSAIRQRDRQIGGGKPVPARYERVTFARELVRLPGTPPAALISPGHPLLGATLDLILERFRALLKRGAVLIDPADPGEVPRVLCFLEHAILDGRTTVQSSRRVVSCRVRFVELDSRQGAVPPGVIGEVLIVPAGLLPQVQGEEAGDGPVRDSLRSELLAMAAVFAAERRLGNEPRDVSAERCGHDIESRMHGEGRVRFLEVKGRNPDAASVTLTRNGIPPC